MPNSDVTAIILAAGQGTRLRPLTNEIPKCMVEVNGKPMLEWQLDTLEAVGIKNIIVVTGYKESKIKDSRIKKVYNADYADTNMIYSLFCAEEYMNGNTIITYGDIIYSKSVLNKLIQDERDIVIASDENWQEYWESRCEDPLSDAETFRKGDNETVISLGKKAENVDEIEGQFIGMVKLSKKGIERVKSTYYECKDSTECSNNAWGSKRDLKKAYMTDMLNHFAEAGELFFNPINRGWFEVDDPSDLKIAEERLIQIQNKFNG